MITQVFFVSSFLQASHWAEVGKPIDGIHQVWCTPLSNPITVKQIGGHLVAEKIMGSRLIPWGDFDNDQHPIGVDVLNNLVLLRVNAIQVATSGTGFGRITCPDFLRLVVRGNYSLLREHNAKVFEGTSFKYQVFLKEPDRSTVALSAKSGEVTIIEREKAAYFLSSFGKKSVKRKLLSSSLLSLDASIAPSMEYLDDRHLILRVIFERKNSTIEKFLSLDKDTGIIDTIYRRTFSEADRRASLLGNTPGRFATMPNGVVGIIIDEKLHFFKNSKRN